MTSLAEIASIYDEIYTNEPHYNIPDAHNKAKLKYILEYAKGVNGLVLDAGCGQGSALQHMWENGVDVIGIELSRVICKARPELWVINTDIISHANEGHRYAGIVCTDVLEHIPQDQISQTLAALRKMSSSAFFGIANLSSIKCGHQLHLIREGVKWWARTIQEHYSQIEVLRPNPEDETLVKSFNYERYFFIVAKSNE